jgi:hypothetical protein
VGYLADAKVISRAFLDSIFPVDMNLSQTFVLPFPIPGAHRSATRYLFSKFAKRSPQVVTDKLIASVFISGPRGFGATMIFAMCMFSVTDKELMAVLYLAYANWAGIWQACQIFTDLTQRVADKSSD